MAVLLKKTPYTWLFRRWNYRFVAEKVRYVEEVAYIDSLDLC